jgi:hypothetical protein
MISRLIGIVVACLIVTSSLPVVAQNQSRLLTPGEKKAYHSCLFASFVADYCRFRAWGSTKAAFRECLIANGTRTSHFPTPYWRWGVEDTCRLIAQGGNP